LNIIPPPSFSFQREVSKNPNRSCTWVHPLEVLGKLDTFISPI
jgi:hypothetical protein